MKILQTDFPGLVLLEPSVFADSRGCFYESWRESTYREAGISEPFLQDNISISQKNVLRGLHFHQHQGQMVSIIHGQVWDVAVDLRPSSPQFKKYFALTLSADKPQQIYMPPGFAHGFCVLSEEAILSYKCTRYYEPKEEQGIIWNDPTLNIPWPITNPILSERDQRFGGMMA